MTTHLFSTTSIAPRVLPARRRHKISGGTVAGVVICKCHVISKTKPFQSSCTNSPQCHSVSGVWTHAYLQTNLSNAAAMRPSPDIFSRLNCFAPMLQVWKTVEFKSNRFSTWVKQLKWLSGWTPSLCQFHLVHTLFHSCVICFRLVHQMGVTGWMFWCNPMQNLSHELLLGFLGLTWKNTCGFDLFSWETTSESLPHKLVITQAQFKRIYKVKHIPYHYHITWKIWAQSKLCMTILSNFIYIYEVIMKLYEVIHIYFVIYKSRQQNSTCVLCL